MAILRSPKVPNRQKLQQQPTSSSQNKILTHIYLLGNIQIATFRRVQEPVEFFHIPEIPQRRKLTDVSFLVTLTISVIVLLSLMIYSLSSSDIQRFIYGYDNCGNVCGQKNTFDTLGECSAQDMTDKPYLVYNETRDYYSGATRRRECASSCDNSFTEKFHRCYPRTMFNDDEDSDLDFFEYVLEKIDVESNNLIILCFSGLGFSILALMLFRYFLNAFVWTMLWCSIGLMFAVTGYLWYLYSDYGYAYLGASIIFTIISFVFLIFILVLMLRIKLIIGFFEEATKIIFSMPLILLEPILTFIANFVVIAIFVYTFLLMETSGSLQEEGTYYRNPSNPPVKSYAYIPDGVMIFAMCLSVIMLIWMLQFTLACQHMVISGAVSAYYFARNKLALVSPIYTSFYNLIRFHLGTAAFGSFTITVVTVLKIFIRALSNDNACLRLLYICFKPLEDLLKYLTSMGYIETAIHGQALCRSGMRAINLIVSNLISAVAMNAIGNLVFFMAKLVVVILNVGVGLLMHVSGVTLFFGGVTAFLCIHCIFVVFEIAVDTIFLCYCEDQCLNDGNINPYVTSLELHNYIKKAQKLTIALEQQKQKQNNAK